jgi:hypothetical protein
VLIFVFFKEKLPLEMIRKYSPEEAKKLQIVSYGKNIY